MQVVSSSINLSAAHRQLEYKAIEERVEVRVTGPSPQAARPACEPGDSCDISDNKSLIVSWLFEYLTGKKPPPIRTLQTHGAPQSDGGGQAPPAARVAYARREIVHQEESSRFKARGSVTLASGRTINFSLELNLNRELTQVNGVAFQAGNMKDPLVVNLDGAGVRLTGERRPFDLDGDGTSEMIASLAEGSQWLAIDRNGNGKIDNGTELFGPETGSGFAELAALDGNASGWVDSGDTSFGSLGVWDGSRFTSLADAGIGALSVDSMATPFTLQANGVTAGQVRQTAVYLTEDGKPGAVQEIDIVT